MTPTASPTSKTTGSKGKPNKNDDLDIDVFDENQPSKKCSQLVRTPSVKSISTRSSTSSIKSTASNSSKSSKVSVGKKKSSKRQKVSDGTEKQSPVHVEQKIMGQNQSLAANEEKPDEKNRLEPLSIDQTISGKLNKSRVILTRIDESTVSSVDGDNMKPKHLKRTTPDDGFDDIKLIAKRSKVSKKSKKNNPQRTEMVSHSPANISIVQSKSSSDGLDREDDAAFAKAMKELESADYDLELEDTLFPELEMLDPLALTADEQAVSPVLEYQNEAAENSTQDAETFEHDYQGTFNMNSCSMVPQSTNENRDELNFESDSEADEMHNDDEYESDEEAAKQNVQSQNELETNGESSPSDHSENDLSDDDVISIFGHDENDPFLEAEITENTTSKRQMQLPRWKSQETKANEVPKLIPGSAVTKNTPVPMPSSRIISQPSTSTTSMKIKDFAKQNDSIETFTRKITNNLLLTPSSRDPREQKRLMLAEKQNAMDNGQSSAMQPPKALPPRKPVKERLGLKDKNVTVIRTINKNKTIPSLMSLTLKKPVEMKISDMPSLPAFLPRDEPQGEILPEMAVDNSPQGARVPELPQIPRVNIKDSLVLPVFFQSPEQYRPVFGYLFEKVCRPFMNDECSMNPNRCQFDHRLPDVEYFGNSIEKMLVNDIVETYTEFMLRVPKLFDTYFQVLASYFAKKQRRDVLKRMIIDCDTRFKQHYFPLIVKCFMEMGDSYSKALAGLIQTIKNRSTKTSHEIVKMILDGQNKNIKPFFKVLHQISDQKSYKFSIDHANRLLRLYDSTKNVELAVAILKITADSNLAKMMDQEYLKKFVDHHKQVSAPQ